MHNWLQLRQILSSSGRAGFEGDGRWENAFCQLISLLSPKASYDLVLEALPVSRRPMNDVDALNSLATLGWIGDRHPFRINEFDERVLPCLLINTQDEPAVLLSREGDQFNVLVNENSRSIPVEELANQYPFVYVFRPYNTQQDVTSKFMREGSRHTWFRALFTRFHGILRQVFVAGLVVNLIALATPLFIMLVYDRSISANNAEVLKMLAVGALLVVVLEWMIRNVRSRGLSWLAARLDHIISNRIFEQLTGLKPELVEGASITAQIARIKTFESIRDFFSGSLFLSILEMPYVVLFVITIAVIAGPLVWVPVGICGLYCLICYLVYKKVRVSIRLAAKASSARQGYVIETFSKLKDIRMYGLTDFWLERYREISGNELISHLRLGWLGLVAEAVAHALTLIAAVATMGFGVTLVWSGTITPGALVATMILVWKVLTPFYSFCAMVPRLEQIRNSIVQVNTLMDFDTEEEESNRLARLPRLQGRVEFRQVDFRYQNEGSVIFRDFTATFPAGTLTVVTGENGSGKSSLLKLVKDMYQPDSGSVLIDGFDSRQLNGYNLRKQIAYVPQSPQFFTGTLLSNLQSGRITATRDEVTAALKLADAWKEVERLPEGLDTEIGLHRISLGPILSTKLSLARAYVQAAPVLLIDELPNNLLATDMGKNLLAYVKQSKGQRTVLMATFRTEFIDLAYQVISLSRSRSAKLSTPQEYKESLLMDV